MANQKMYKVDVCEHDGTVGGYERNVTTKYYSNLLNLLADIVDGDDNLFIGVSEGYRPSDFSHPKEVSYDAVTDEGNAGNFAFLYSIGGKAGDEKCLEVYIEEEELL